jgi:hypothetical protein
VGRGDDAGPVSVRGKDIRTLKDDSGNVFGGDIYNAARSDPFRRSPPAAAIVAQPLAPLARGRPFAAVPAPTLDSVVSGDQIFF